MEYHVMDLGSTNGTYLDNTRLLEGIPEVWRANQSLRIGDVWLRLIRPETDASQVSGIRSGISSLRSRAGSNIYKSSGSGFIGVSLSPQQLSVAPGEGVTGTISLLNQSPNVDHYALSITGIPNSWITSLPTNVQLMPGEQTDIPLSLLIPRSPQSRAGQHPLVLRVSSQRDTGQFVEAKLTLTIAAFSQFKTEIQTQRLRAGQPGHLSISNQGNAREIFSVQFTDAAGDLSFEPTQPQLQVSPGETTLVSFHSKEKKQRWIGAEKLYPLAVKVNPAKGESQTLHADLASRGVIPIWVLPTMLLFCLICIGSLLAVGLPFSQSPTEMVTPPLLTLQQQNTQLPIGQGETQDSEAQILTSQAQKAQATQTSQVQTQTALTASNSSIGLTATATWLAADDDRDGLINDQEINLYRTLPGDRDTDKDGLEDGKEVNDFHTNPLDPDTDIDGLKDGEEVSAGLNPISKDTDGDGTPDNVDKDPRFTSTPIPTVTAQPSPTATSTTASALCDQAQFVADVTIPAGTRFSPGTTFTKTWRLKNIGACAWSMSYQLVYFSGEQMGAPASVAFAQNVAVGQTVDISVTMTAPAAAGSYSGFWMFKNASGSLFGIGQQADKPFSVDINVNGLPSTITPTATP
jgi:hypothetical protein